MSSTGKPSPESSRRSSIDLSGNAPKKFLNGWTKEQEALMAEWSDKAGCYRWLHDRCEKKYSRLNMGITIPVIILSTLTGTANFALDGFIPPGDENAKKYAQAGIGAVSIFAGILTTLGNFLRFAQGSESHRVAGISWGKFQRQIAVELAIHPNERIDAMDFLKICRAEMDRLIEQSPAIPDDIIREFHVEFKSKPDIKKPEIVGGLEHTHVFEDKHARLKLLTSEMALTLMHKKKVLRNELVPDLEKIIKKEVDRKLSVVENQLSDLSGTLVKKLAPSGKEEFSFTNPLRKRPTLSNVNWESIRAKRYDTQEKNTLVTPAEIRLDMSQLRRKSSTDTLGLEVVTPHETVIRTD